MVTMTLALTPGSGCGTVAGNPKKPSTGSSPAPAGAIVYTLPGLGFTVPADATADESSLLLADDNIGGSERGLLVATSRRLDRIVKQIDALSDKVTKIAAAERGAGNVDEVLRFKAKGAGGKLDGKLQPLAAGGSYAYEAVLCQNGTAFADFKWSEDGHRIALTRNFATKPDDGDDSFALVSQVTVTKDDGVSLDVVSQGDMPDSELPGRDGDFLAEHVRARKLASGEVQLSLVGDRAAALPTPGEYEGDSYLVSRLIPKAAPASGFQTEFVGYFKGFQLFCRDGFDEAAPNLWQPGLTGPRFCIGRPFGGQRFTSQAQFKGTLADLQPVGLLSKTTLESVQLADDLSCD